MVYVIFYLLNLKYLIIFDKISISKCVVITAVIDCFVLNKTVEISLFKKHIVQISYLIIYGQKTINKKQDEAWFNGREAKTHC